MQALALFFNYHFKDMFINLEYLYKMFKNLFKTIS